LTKFYDTFKPLEEKLGLDLEKAKNATRTEDFDNFFTSKVHGFRNAEEYYRGVSCMKWIKSIKKPTLAISSRDDSLVS